MVRVLKRPQNDHEELNGHDARQAVEVPVAIKVGGGIEICEERPGYNARADQRISILAI